MPSRAPHVFLTVGSDRHLLQPGDLIKVFGGWIARGLTLRVTRLKVYNSTPDFMVYLTGYVMGPDGHATGIREDALVDVRHLRLIQAATPRMQRPVNTRVPRQRAAADLNERTRPGRLRTSAREAGA